MSDKLCTCQKCGQAHWHYCDPPMTPPTKAMLELADEIEASDGIYLMGVKRQLGIKKTAQVIAALRSSQNGERERVIEEALVQSASALAATISLLQRIPKAKMVAPSNKMFDQMMRDYEAALENARVVLCALKSGEKGS